MTIKRLKRQKFIIVALPVSGRLFSTLSSFSLFYYACIRQKPSFYRGPTLEFFEYLCRLFWIHFKIHLQSKTLLNSGCGLAFIAQPCLWHFRFSNWRTRHFPTVLPISGFHWNLKPFLLSVFFNEVMGCIDVKCLIFANETTFLHVFPQC